MQIGINSENLCKCDPKIVSNIFRNIETRNNEAIKEIQHEKREFEEKAQKIINFIMFRTKVDKLESAYNLMFSAKQIKRINRLTEKTEDKLLSEALKKTNGDKKKAITLLFDTSSDVSI